MGTGLEIPIAFAVAQGGSTALEQRSKRKQAEEQLRQETTKFVDQKGQLHDAATGEVAIGNVLRHARGGGGHAQGAEDSARIAGLYGADLFALKTNFDTRRKLIEREGKENFVLTAISAASGFLAGLQANSLFGVDSPFATPKTDTRGPERPLQE